MRILWLLLLAICVGMPVRGVAQPALDLGTPEAAVRSYWRMQDALDSVATALLTGPGERDPFAATRALYEQTVAGRAAEVLAAPYVRQTYAREVEAVDFAGESGALVTTVIRNTTPLPAGTTLTHEQEEMRTEGQQFRYLLQRDGAAWRITQIQRWSDLGDGWQDLLVEGMTLPLFPRW